VVAFAAASVPVFVAGSCWGAAIGLLLGLLP
jgi:hypothetical protein